MNIIEKRVEILKEQSLIVFFTTVFAKFLFGVGLGILLTVYIQTNNWSQWGWALVIVSLILSIPVMRSFFLVERRESE